MTKKESVFIEFLGNCSKTRVWDILTDWHNCEFTISDIVDGAETNRKKAYEITNQMVKEGLLVAVKKNTPKKKKYTNYKLNLKDIRVKAMINLNRKCIAGHIIKHDLKRFK